MIKMLCLFLLPLAMFAQIIDFYGNTENSINTHKFEINSSPLDTPPGWSNDTLLSLNDGLESIYPRHAIDKRQHIHVVWKDNRRLGGRDEIHYRKYDGSNWSEIFSVGNLDTVHNSAWVTTDNQNNVHVVFLRWYGAPYTYYDVGYRKFDDALGQWEDEVRLTFEDSLGLAARPKVITDSRNRVFVFWLAERDSPTRIWFQMKDTSGWHEKKEVTKESDLPNGYYGICIADNDMIHLCWQDYRTATAEIWHKYLEADTWSTGNAVTNNGFTSVYPRMAADSANNIHLMYGGGTSLAEKIHHLMWDFTSRTWGSQTHFPSQMGVPHPDIAIHKKTGDRHVTFHEYLGYTCMMYKKYDAASAQWLPNVQLTFHQFTLLDPQIAVDTSNYVHLVWWDERFMTGQEEILYKTNKIPVPIEETEKKSAECNFLIYPNPFSSHSNIHFSLPFESKVVLRLYDITGKLTKVICDNRKDAGIHRIDLDCRDLGSGVYFVSFQTEKAKRKIERLVISK
jgi:hypothetical protein